MKGKYKKSERNIAEKVRRKHKISKLEELAIEERIFLLSKSHNYAIGGTFNVYGPSFSYHRSAAPIVA